MTKVYKINPAIQPYAWGGKSYISQWLGINNEANTPMAEAWYGDHPLAPSIISETHSTLSRLIQLHPSKEAAEKGFELENQNGIPLNAPNRNYKDNNHKPEILYALSDFWMLQGFESIEEIKNRFHILIPDWAFAENDTWKSILTLILQINHAGNAIDCFNSIQSNLSNTDIANKNKIYHWLHKAVHDYPLKDEKIDIGLLVMLLLKVQYLKPGQVGYQAPGVLHAYLEGQNVELMANSDNVLRGGLTPKYIDASELMKHVNFSESGQYLIPAIYIMENEASFNPPVKDFMLKHFLVKKGVVKELQFETASILLIKSGELCIDGIDYYDGESIFIPAYSAIDVLSNQDSEYFLASGTL